MVTVFVLFVLGCAAGGALWWFLRKRKKNDVALVTALERLLTFLQDPHTICRRRVGNRRPAFDKALETGSFLFSAKGSPVYASYECTGVSALLSATVEGKELSIDFTGGEATSVSVNDEVLESLHPDVRCNQQKLRTLRNAVRHAAGFWVATEDEEVRMKERRSAGNALTMTNEP